VACQGELAACAQRRETLRGYDDGTVVVVSVGTASSSWARAT
jgi:hypothetical protein